jgi:hypothetical protein
MAVGINGSVSLPQVSMFTAINKRKEKSLKSKFKKFVAMDSDTALGPL